MVHEFSQTRRASFDVALFSCDLQDDSVFCGKTAWNRRISFGIPRRFPVKNSSTPELARQSGVQGELSQGRLIRNGR